MNDDSVMKFLIESSKQPNKNNRTYKWDSIDFGRLDYQKSIELLYGDMKFSQPSSKIFYMDLVDTSKKPVRNKPYPTQPELLKFKEYLESHSIKL
jgi:hypothetical protein